MGWPKGREQVGIGGAAQGLSGWESNILFKDRNKTWWRDEVRKDMLEARICIHTEHFVS